MRIFLCISHLRASICLYDPTVLLAGNTLTINIFLIILGAKRAEDYAHLSVYQSLTNQCLFI